MEKSENINEKWASLKIYLEICIIDLQKEHILDSNALHNYKLLFMIVLIT